MAEHKIAIFQGKRIRRHWDEDNGIITLINKKDAVPKIKKILPWGAMFHYA